MNLFHTHAQATLDAFNRSFAVIEFSPDGTVLNANDKFCQALGYEPKEIIGKHHRLFVGEKVASSSGYSQFWSDLANGKPNAGEFRRFDKSGQPVWIQASYCPVRSRNGSVISVVKLAADVTSAKLQSAENQSVLDAVSRSQGIISFTPNGTIVDANDNFLRTMGYALSEIVGKHHRMFVTSTESQSPQYAQFWERLANGEFISEEFRRVGKGGKEVLIQAAYNPVIDDDGKVIMVKKMVFDLNARMQSINHLGEGLNRLANGDLTFSLDTPLVETMESLRRDYNGAVEKLRALLLRISNESSSIQHNSQEVSNSADELSKRTEQQAANLEETAAALDEITATGKKAAEGALHARNVVSTAQSDAVRTGEVVRKTVEAMGGIEKSAQQISQIIGVIDEIAFQTNLLALNAGVEAARAGEAGRGFAVVASEVRALAQRSAEAAKEIKELISRSTAQVSEGVGLVAETGKALDRILRQVNDINAVIVDIASGAQEQATGLGQINSAINQMDQTTQQNAAMVEETTAASHSLLQEADTLKELIAQFNVGGAGSTRPEAAIRPLPMRPSPRPRAARVASGITAKPNSSPVPKTETEWADF